MPDEDVSIGVLLPFLTVNLLHSINALLELSPNTTPLFVISAILIALFELFILSVSNVLSILT